MHLRFPRNSICWAKLHSLDNDFGKSFLTTGKLRKRIIIVGWYHMFINSSKILDHHLLLHSAVEREFAVIGVNNNWSGAQNSCGGSSMQ